MIFENKWVTRQVDCTNAFTQADLQEEFYIESPKDFQIKDKRDLVLKLLKSLYGLKQAPKSFLINYLVVFWNEDLCNLILTNTYS